MVFDEPMKSVMPQSDGTWRSTLFGRSLGLAAAHKVANAVFHLQALQCFARRCHPCVQGDVRAAAIFEDDVEYVASPAGGPHLLPTLLEETFSFLQEDNLTLVNKLHLGAQARASQPTHTRR